MHPLNIFVTLLPLLTFTNSNPLYSRASQRYPEDLTTSPGEYGLFFRVAARQFDPYNNRLLQLSKTGHLVIDPLSPVFGARLTSGQLESQRIPGYEKPKPTGAFLGFGPKMKSPTGSKGLRIQEVKVAETNMPDESLFLHKVNNAGQYFLTKTESEGTTRIWLICDAGNAEWVLNYASINTTHGVFLPDKCNHVGLDADVAPSD